MQHSHLNVYIIHRNIVPLNSPAPPIYYVPVLRSTDNCTPPQLTPPCTIAEYHLHQRALSDDRGTPVIGQAFAGPMSPVQVSNEGCVFALAIPNSLICDVCVSCTVMWCGSYSKPFCESNSS